MPAKKTETKYIRNVRHVPISVRLDTGRRIELRPRGQRGDCAPVNKEEMEDHKFVNNMDILFEVIPAGEAKEVISKQTINQQAIHPALQQMRNAKGEEFTKGVVLEESSSDTAKGTGVASVDERGMITRFAGRGSVDNPISEVPGHVNPEEASDWLARQKVDDNKRPEENLGLKVTKGDTQNQ